MRGGFVFRFISDDPQIHQQVNAGMLRLYEGEVLGKLPVIQHFVFGCVFFFARFRAISPRAYGGWHMLNAHRIWGWKGVFVFLFGFCAWSHTHK